MLSTKPISPDFPYQSNYVNVLNSTMHYVDEGQGDPILFLHGNPTSSYLWRNIIPYLTPHARCIAPDLIGMGKSGNPDIEYQFFDHVRYLEAFIEELGLTNITLVIHDWGSSLGFHYASRHEDNVKAIAFMEAQIMPTPSWDVMPDEVQQLFKAFRTPDVGWDMIVNQNMFVEQVLPGSVIRQLTDDEMNHYRAPFENPAHRKAVWRWPNEIPIGGEPADVTEAVNTYNQWLKSTDIPKLLFFASPGAIMVGAVLDWCKEFLPSLKTVDLGEGLHFLQEDHPHEIGAALADWYQSL
jgi:haloalkane dehalogenase